MPRKQRTISVGIPHHVTQRGVLKVNIFEENRDYEIYKELLLKEQRRYGLRIWAYCLMTNHVHLIAVPDDMICLSLSIKNVHSNYARYFNSKKGRNGHLMQQRFYSCPVPMDHAATAIRYVERNPVAASSSRSGEDAVKSTNRDAEKALLKIYQFQALHNLHVNNFVMTFSL